MLHFADKAPSTGLIANWAFRQKPPFAETRPCRWLCHQHRRPSVRGSGAQADLDTIRSVMPPRVAGLSRDGGSRYAVSGRSSDGQPAVLEPLA